MSEKSERFKKIAENVKALPSEESEIVWIVGMAQVEQLERIADALERLADIAQVDDSGMAFINVASWMPRFKT